MVSNLPTRLPGMTGYGSYSVRRLFWIVWRWKIDTAGSRAKAGLSLGKAGAQRAGSARLRDAKLKRSDGLGRRLS
jgi:hypothetical protein